MSPLLLHTHQPTHLSFSSHIRPDPTHQFLTSTFSHLSISTPPPSTTIRMGGGPRTYPGGVSKWQWKRMQLKKSKQLLRARLARERQIYEMRKRAELNAAVSELERPWEVVETAPKLFSVTADEQLKVLADRFQKPGGFDMWSEKDGPQLFESVDGVTSSRFFPKGVVHSIKPYERITHSNSGHENLNSGLGSGLDSDGDGLGHKSESRGDWRKGSKRGDGAKGQSRLSSKVLDGKSRVLGSGSGGDELDWRKGSKRGNGVKERSGLSTKVFDMNLQEDGSYGILKKDAAVEKDRRRPERK